MQLDFISKGGLVLSLADNALFWLVNVDGLTSGVNSLSTTTIGNVDGDIVNNVRAQPRGIVADLRFKNGVNVEDAKRDILRVIKLKQPCALVWTQNERTLQIQGIVESIEMPRFNNAVTMQVSIHCPSAFWEDVADVIEQIDEYIDLHYFTDLPDDMLYFPFDGIPFGAYDQTRRRSIYNSGDIAAGMTITIIAYTTVTNPLIYDQDGNFFGVGYNQTSPINKNVVMNSGDEIVISTQRGDKWVTLNGVSIIDKVKPQSTWLQLEAGENDLTVSSDNDNEKMTFYISYKRRYV